MIRKHVQSGWWLIRQADHAALSGRLAGAWDATTLGGSTLAEPLRLAATWHDCGWPLHDDLAPTLNDDNLPRDVFESNIAVSAPIWTASAERAAASEPYAGLLVSLHVLHLSAYASRAGRAAGFGVGDRSGRFALLKFQQRMFELQGQLRLQLGMAVDQPVNLGLNRESTDEREQRLVSDLQLLQTLDVLSLALCRTRPPTDRLTVRLRAFAAETSFRLRPLDVGQLELSPWPFASAAFEAQVPYRPLPAKPLADAATLARALHAAPECHAAVRLQPPSAV